METVLVTGGTGLIGKHLIERLLARGHRVLSLLRPGAETRRAEVLARLEAAAGASPGELHWVPGDVTEAGLGIGNGTRPFGDAPLAHVFHLAALYDLTAPEADLVRANVEGTRNLLATLRSWGFEGVLHHVSSIAVAGDHSGVFRESDLDVGQSHPHPYHRTKLESEQLVRQSGMRTRIYRPGAVVGHSHTGEMDRVDGPYFAFKPLRVLRDHVPRWVTVPLTTRGRIPLAPVDFVADAIDHIAHLPGRDGRTFHVVDPDPPEVARALDLLSAAAGGPRFRKVRVRGLSQLRRTPLLGGVRALGAVRFLRDEVLRDLDVPTEAMGAARFELELDTTELDGALDGSAVRCPRPEAYFPALWDYWLRHLDPDRDPEQTQRRYFEGRRVLVTGASSGIGAALAEQCAALGAEVVLVARREEALAEVTGRIHHAGGRAAFIAADLNSDEACDALVRQVLEQHGPVDVLINNAGHSIRRTVAESLNRFHDLERLMRINYFAPARLIRGLLPAMRQQRFGHIVNALTAGARIVSPRFGAYTASKAALGQLSTTLAAELAHEGVRVTNAYLPWVRTPMMDATGKYADTPAKTPDEAAAWVLQAVSEQRSEAISFGARQRFVAQVVVPRMAERVANTVLRIYADDPDEHPDFALDRTLLDRFIPGRMI